MNSVSLLIPSLGVALRSFWASFSTCHWIVHALLMCPSYCSLCFFLDIPLVLRLSSIRLEDPALVVPLLHEWCAYIYIYLHYPLLLLGVCIYAHPCHTFYHSPNTRRIYSCPCGAFCLWCIFDRYVNTLLPSCASLGSFLPLCLHISILLRDASPVSPVYYAHLTDKFLNHVFELYFAFYTCHLLNLMQEQHPISHAACENYPLLQPYLLL